MSTNKAQWANRPRIWSISRRTLMNRCPRAWILKYGFGKRRGGFNQHLRNIADWSSPWRLMQRALRGVIIERLEFYDTNRAWIEKDLASKMPLSSYINNYYLSNSICRASKTMGKLAKARNSINFKKAS